MEFVSRMTSELDPERIIEELTSDISDLYDLGFLFISSFNKVSAEEILMMLKKKVRIKNLAGCTVAGVIGNVHEVERRPANVLILAKLPEVKITPFHMKQLDLDLLNSAENWFEFLGIFPVENPIFLILPDPFALDMNKFLESINQFYPNCPVLGGLASGAFQPGQNKLVLNNDQYEEGVVGMVLAGNVSVETIVSQGCRPIGQSYIVTKAKDNIIYELAGRPMLNVLQDILHKAPARDKLLAQEALFVGIAMNEYKHELKRGDFLIRGLMAIDQNNGAGAIAEYISAGQTVQFHVRDADAATEDLVELLTAQNSKSKLKPKGALVFSCNGRGENLFKAKDHDITLIQQFMGPVPAAGFFCAGEIGPVCKNNFLHGFTSSIALFYPKTDAQNEMGASGSLT